MKSKKKQRNFIIKKSFPLLALAVIIVGVLLIYYNNRTAQNIVVYYPAQCIIEPTSINVTPTKEEAFINDSRTGEPGLSITLYLSCGGESVADGEYSLISTLTTDNHVIYDKNTYIADASPSSTVNTTCNVTLATFEQENNGDRYVLFDCGRLTFRMNYEGKLQPETQ